MEPKYKLVRVGNCDSIHFADYGETIHPAIGPAAEAEALYVRQLKLRERMAQAKDDFIIFDIGLGAAANALGVFHATKDISGTTRVISFDNTIEPLRFALNHAEQLGYFTGYEKTVDQLIAGERIQFANGKQNVTWELHLGDFPPLLKNVKSSLPAPHAILFDPFSPTKNPAMWTQDVFSDLFQALDPGKPCSLATYSRSTMTRVALLLAGFFVGSGQATGAKEETTVAANTLELIEKPLDSKWLERARISTSAEPLREGIYRQAPLTPETWEKLKRHSQFS